MIDDIKHLKSEYETFHKDGDGLIRMLFLCRFIEFSGCKLPMSKVGARLKNLAKREGKLKLEVESIDDLDEGFHLLFTAPESWRNTNTTFLQMYSRRIYFLNQWIKELENV